MTIYQTPDTGNSMNDFITSLSAFVQLAPHLLEATSASEFALVLDTLARIDRRSLARYLRRHAGEIPAEYVWMAERYMV